MATIASVVSDHNSLSEADETEAAKQILGNLDDAQLAAVFAFALSNASNGKLSNVSNLIYGINGYDFIIQRTETDPVTSERILITKVSGGFPRVPITPRP